jgi:hypothetical protein
MFVRFSTNEADELRAEAAHWRCRAQSVPHEKVASALMTLAEECETKAGKIDEETFEPCSYALFSSLPIVRETAFP